MKNNNENVFGEEVGTRTNCIWMRAKSIHSSTIYFILNSGARGLVLPIVFNRLGGFLYYLNHSAFTIILANSAPEKLSFLVCVWLLWA